MGVTNITTLPYYYWHIHVRVSVQWKHKKITLISYKLRLKITTISIFDFWEGPKYAYELENMVWQLNTFYFLKYVPQNLEIESFFNRCEFELNTRHIEMIVK